MIEKYFALQYYIDITGLIIGLIILAPFIIIWVLCIILDIVDYIKERWHRE